MLMGVGVGEVVTATGELLILLSLDWSCVYPKSKYGGERQVLLSQVKIPSDTPTVMRCPAATGNTRLQSSCLC